MAALGKPIAAATATVPRPEDPALQVANAAILLAEPRVNADALAFALCNGCERGRLVFVDQLLSAHPPVDAAPRDNQPIRSAARHGHAALVDRLLAAPGVDPSACHNEALRSAADHGHAAVVERLLADPRVDPCARDYEAVQSAARNGDLATLRLLLADPRVRVADCGDAALCAAAALGNLPVVELLLGLPCPQLRPAAALHEAMLHGHVALGRRIGDDPRVRPESWSCYGSFRGAPFKEELKRGDAAAADIAARLAADPSVDPSYNSNEALCEAARLGHVAIVGVLLADPRVESTPTHAAAMRCDTRARQATSPSWSGCWTTPPPTPACCTTLPCHRLQPAAPLRPATDSSLLHHFALRMALAGQHFAVVHLLLNDRRAAPSLRAHAGLLSNVFSSMMWQERREGPAAVTVGELSMQEIRLAAEAIPPAGTYGRRNASSWLRKHANARVLGAAAWARRRAAVLCRAQMMVRHLKRSSDD